MGTSTLSCIKGAISLKLGCQIISWIYFTLSTILWSLGKLADKSVKYLSALDQRRGSFALTEATCEEV